MLLLRFVLPLLIIMNRALSLNLPSPLLPLTTLKTPLKLDITCTGGAGTLLPQMLNIPGSSKFLNAINFPYATSCLAEKYAITTAYNSPLAAHKLSTPSFTPSPTIPSLSIGVTAALSSATPHSKPPHGFVDVQADLPYTPGQYEFTFEPAPAGMDLPTIRAHEGALTSQVSKRFSCDGDRSPVARALSSRVCVCVCVLVCVFSCVCGNFPLTPLR